MARNSSTTLAVEIYDKMENGIMLCKRRISTAGSRKSGHGNKYEPAVRQGNTT
jgi:hypothetical protein